jgi:hypothetical protein
LVNDIVHSCVKWNRYELNTIANGIESDKASKQIILKIERFLDERTDDYPRSILIKAESDRQDVAMKAKSVFPNCSIKMNGSEVTSIVHTNYEKSMFSFALKQLNMARSIYASLVFSSDASERILPRLNVVFEFLDMYFERFPSAPIEIVHVFEDNPKQEERPKVGENLRKHLRVINVPEKMITSIKRKNGIDYFPEFILKNIGIRRSRGRYVVCFNADTIPPYSFLEAARMNELSPFTLIRTQFNNMNMDSLSQESLRRLLINQGVQHVLYNWTLPSKTMNTAFQKQGSGNFQGCHRSIWEKIGGYAEGPWVFHVDTAMMIEFSAITELTYVSKYIGSIHIEHNPVSKETKHFPEIKTLQDKSPCRGVSPKKLVGISKKNWGLPEIRFNISNSY